MDFEEKISDFYRCDLESDDLVMNVSRKNEDLVELNYDFNTLRCLMNFQLNALYSFIKMH